MSRQGSPVLVLSQYTSETVSLIGLMASQADYTSSKICDEADYTSSKICDEADYTSSKICDVNLSDRF